MPLFFTRSDAMSRIFISYRREDSAGEAGRIYDYLERKFGREAIFKDVDAIAFGDNFRDRIHEAVGQCEILLAIIGRRWLTVKDTAGRRRLYNPADWVRLEIETALQRDVRVIPVLLDGVRMPTTQDLPESLQPLCYRNAARVRHDPDFRQDIKRVLGVLEQHLLYKTEKPQVKQAAEQLQLLHSAFTNSDLGDKQKAIDDCDKAIQINPNYADAYSARAIIKYELGDKQGAIDDCDKVIQLNPDDADAYGARGQARYESGDKQGAIADYNKVIQLNPNDADAYNNRGLVKAQLGDQQGAIADYNKVIQLNPNDADAYSNRGLAKSELGGKQDAIADYDKAIQIKPDFSNAYCNRGVAKSNLGDKQGAISDYKKAMSLSQQQENISTYNLAQNNLKLISSD